MQNDRGRVKSGSRTIARGTFVAPETVSHVLSRSVTLGLLDDFVETERGFTCRISGWEQDQERGRAAARQAISRSSKPQPRGLSRSVTESHANSPTEENSRKETPPLTPLTGGNEKSVAFLDQVKGVLRKAVNESTMHSWLEPLAAQGYDDDVLTVEAPGHAAAWVRQRFGPLLNQAATEIAQRPVRVVVAETDEERSARLTRDAAAARKTRRAEKESTSEGRAA